MATAPEPGTILLEKYSVERVLGRGGMGFVVAVRHIRLNELFAIKMLRPDLQNKAEASERFLREARALARLRGEHAVRVQDVGTFEDGSPYMLMEYLEGRDLKQVVEERGPLPLEDAALYVMQACEAVAEAHELGIIHRDIKPANLFLTKRPNGTPCVKVLDFGISKDVISAHPDLTRTGAFIGSPAYVSPERLANNKIANVQSDVWAIGVVLYELIEGRVPFRAKLITDLVAKIISSPHVPLNERRPGIPDEFEAIVQRCLEKRPERRYSSVREIIYDLGPFAADYQRPHINRNAAPPSVRAAAAPAAAPAAPAAAPQLEKTVLLPMPPPKIEDELTVPVSAPRARQAVTDPMPKMPKIATDPMPAMDFGPSERMAQTTHGWGNTWDALTGKDKKPLILGGAALIAVLAVAILYIALSPSSDDTTANSTPPEKTAQAAKPTAPTTATAPPTTKVIRVEPIGDAAPTENLPTPQDSPTAAVSTQPATTAVKPRVTTKKKTIRGYDE